MLSKQFTSIESKLKKHTVLKTHSETIMKLIKKTFEKPFDFLNRKILEQDEFFRAYTDDSSDSSNTSSTSSNGSNSSSSEISNVSAFDTFDAFDAFLDLLDSLLMELKDGDEKVPNFNEAMQYFIMKIVNENLEALFYEMLILLSDKLSEPDILANVMDLPVDEIKQILSMSLIKRVLYFLMKDIDLTDSTVSLDGGRCYEADWIRDLKLPYKECAGANSGKCLLAKKAASVKATNEGGKKEDDGKEEDDGKGKEEDDRASDELFYHIHTWDYGKKQTLCLQSSKYFDEDSRNDGFEDNIEKMLKAFMREHILSLPEKRVKQLVHFIRISRIEDPNVSWVFNMEGQLTKLSKEMFS